MHKAAMSGISFTSKLDRIPDRIIREHIQGLIRPDHRDLVRATIHLTRSRFFAVALPERSELPITDDPTALSSEDKAELKSLQASLGDGSRRDLLLQHEFWRFNLSLRHLGCTFRMTYIDFFNLIVEEFLREQH